MDAKKTVHQLAGLPEHPSKKALTPPHASRPAASILLREIEDSVLHHVGSQKLQEQIGALLKLDAEHEEKRHEQLFELAQLLARSSPIDGRVSAPSKDGRFTLEATDPLRLALSVWPAIGAGRPVTAKRVIEALKAQGVCSVRIGALRDALSRAHFGETVTDVPIASGQPARPGTDASVEYFARDTPEGELGRVSADRVRNPEFQAYCQAGDEIARYTPPTAGVDGRGVLGERIPAEPGRGEPPVAGKHTSLRDHAVVAESAGVVRLSLDRIDVEKLLVIPHDLQPSHGAIDFEGDILIRGAVRSQATISATGSIEVVGTVEAATLRTHTGDIRLRSGVAGRGAAKIESGRDIIAKFAENADLTAARDIVLKVGALHCHPVAGREVSANQGKGSIGGGSISARGGISVKRLGLRSGRRMEIALGVPLEVTVELAHLERRRIEHQAKQDRTRELIERMTHTLGDISRFTSDELQTYTRLKQMLLLLELECEELAERRLEMLSALPPDQGVALGVTKDVLSEITVAFGRHRETFPPGGHAVFRYRQETGRIARLT